MDKPEGPFHARLAHPLITTSTSKREERFASPPSAAANGNSVRPDIVLDMYHQPRVSPSYNAGGSDSPATGSDGGFGGVSATALVMPEPEGPDGSTRTHVIDMLDQSRKSVQEARAWIRRNPGDPAINRVQRQIDFITQLTNEAQQRIDSAATGGGAPS